jgi:ApaG protein
MKDSINISVDVNFIESQSDIASNQFVFSYTVKITNNGEIGAQLLTRHWKIEDESGKIEDVIGEGVVGQQPSPFSW